MTREHRNLDPDLTEDEIKAVQFMIDYLSSSFTREELNPWELNFLESLEERMKHPHPSLSRKQYHKLQEVFENH